jgi:hypothetical protein
MFKWQKLFTFDMADFGMLDDIADVEWPKISREGIADVEMVEILCGRYRRG